jgi:hypothetical protein
MDLGKHPALESPCERRTAALVAAALSRFTGPARPRMRRIAPRSYSVFDAYGGGSFKPSGAGAFNKVAVQRFGVRERGGLRVTSGSRGPPDHRVGV